MMAQGLAFPGLLCCHVTASLELWGTWHCVDIHKGSAGHRWPTVLATAMDVLSYPSASGL